jgi:acyl-CoA reductase-like NAD-dependent aldehyde dehydrogenase
MKAESVEHAIELVNDLIYGLSDITDNDEDDVIEVLKNDSSPADIRQLL